MDNRPSSVPQVSVVIPCYRQAQYLPDAVESVVAQSFPDWELTIVDDGSPDDTAAVAEQLIARHPDRRIRLLRQRNAGVAAARNAGVLASTGALILPLDADDMLDPSFLAKTVAVLQARPDVDIIGASLQPFGQVEFAAPRLWLPMWVLPSMNQLAYASLYRRSVWERVGGYDPAFVVGFEDWDFWVGAQQAGCRVVRLTEPLLRYRHHGVSRTTQQTVHQRELHAQIRRKHPAAFRWWKRVARWPFASGVTAILRALRLRDKVLRLARRSR